MPKEQAIAILEQILKTRSLMTLDEAAAVFQALEVLKGEK